ncbi:hypothetical protein C8R46DRAFT_1353865 [Mycena filopes]|nr:hypothetical protein C8R46DRAFT_1353865 [Mycena filopes]
MAPPKIQFIADFYRMLFRLKSSTNEGQEQPSFISFRPRAKDGTSMASKPEKSGGSSKVTRPPEPPAPKIAPAGAAPAPKIAPASAAPAPKIAATPAPPSTAPKQSAPTNSTGGRK